MDIEDVEFAKTNKHPSTIVLKALLQGHEIVLDNRKIKLAERVGGSYSPVIIGTSTKGEVTKPCVLGWDDMSLSYFLKQCEKLTEDELAVISANTVLTEINRERF